MSTKTDPDTSSGALPEGVVASEPSKRGSMMKVVRVVVSLVLIGVVFSQVGVRDALSAIASADPRPLAFALLLNFVGATITASRWRVLLAAQSVHTSSHYLVARWMEACFFNQFLPSTIGGDSKRIYDSWKLGASKSGAVAAVGVDRLLGLLALMSFGVAALFLSSVSFGDNNNLVLFVVAAAAMLLAAAITIFFPPRWMRKIMLWLKGQLPGFLQKFASKVEASFAAYRGQGKVLSIALGLSVLLQINVIGFYYLVGLSLGVKLDFVDYMLMIPIASVVLLLPITINGIGLREGIFALLFTSFALEASLSVAFAWVSFGLFTTFGLLGGIVYALHRQAEERSD